MLELGGNVAVHVSSLCVAVWPLTVEGLHIVPGDGVVTGDVGITVQVTAAAQAVLSILFVFSAVAVESESLEVRDRTWFQDLFSIQLLC
jgi:hypothetical protein